MTGPPDFSTTVNFGDTAFGFVAFRHETYLLAGKEGFWLHLPSWLFALNVLALALVEGWVLKFFISYLKKLCYKFRTSRAET